MTNDADGRLLAAFRRALSLPDTVPASAMVRGTLAEWDSMGHMELVMEIENTFGIRIPDADVLTLDSYERALEVVSEASSADGV